MADKGIWKLESMKIFIEYFCQTIDVVGIKVSTLFFPITNDTYKHLKIKRLS